MLPPSFQCFDNIFLNARVLEKDPRLVNEERFECRRDLAVGDDGICSMQDVTERRLEDFMVLAHFLKVEALELRERNGVFGIVEEKSELPAASPFCEAL